MNLSRTVYMRSAFARYMRRHSKEQLAEVPNYVVVSTLVLAALDTIIRRGHMPDWRVSAILVNLLVL
jgi:hypothetical protein